MRLAALFLAFVASTATAGNTWVHVRGSWVPAPQAVEALKAGLQSFMKTQDRALRPWHEYAFQYQGQIDRGRRYVLVNALCRVDPSWGLQAEIVLVMDGGPCYFHLKYDPVEGSFYGVYVNPEK